MDEYDSYAGKTDRELLVEIYTTVKDNCGIIEDHECRMRELENQGRKQGRLMGFMFAAGAGLMFVWTELRSYLPF